MNKKSRTQHPLYTTQRLNVPDDLVDWNQIYLDYFDNRPYYEDPAVTNNLTTAFPWAEPHIQESDYNYTLKDRKTIINGYEQTLSEANIQFDEYNLPLNPKGRTGMWGPGLLGKNGPNQTADPVFTRWAPITLTPVFSKIKFCMNNPIHFICNPLTEIRIIIKNILLLIPHLQMIAIQRRDTKEWAIPGGMVEHGETVSQTLRNELNQEVCNNMDPNKASKELDKIFNTIKSNVIYRGYVDDPRNTDSRWLETTAVHFHCPWHLAKEIKFEAGDDAQDVCWLDMTSLDTRYKNLYASHKYMTDMVVDKVLFDTFKNLDIILLIIIGIVYSFQYVYQKM